MTLADQLADARNQLHLLLTGQAATVFVDQNGERIEYQRASADRLAAYIRDLERRLAGQRPQSAIRFSTSKGLL